MEQNRDRFEVTFFVSENYSTFAFKAAATLARFMHLDGAQKSLSALICTV
tara:strand:- start:590 stop:739 length:150 start_codon:yes stop_codon:yes gene_type:complete